MGWLVFSNVFVAFCGAALTGATYPLFGLPPRLDAPVLLVFFGTLLIYNLDRLVEPSPGHTPHELWVAKHRVPLWGMTAAAGLGCIASAAALPIDAWWSLGLAAGLSLGYCLPVYRGGGRWRRLKALPGGKLLMIAGVWTYATAGLPLIASGVAAQPLHAAAIISARFAFLLAVALPFDLPDSERDRAAGIRTIPQRLGLAGTRRAAIAFTALFASLSMFVPWPYAAACLTTAAVTLAVLSALRSTSGVIFYEVLLDGLLLLQAGLLLLVWAGTDSAV